jgi:hypothetical protein
MFYHLLLSPEDVAKLSERHASASGDEEAARTLQLRDDRPLLGMVRPAART